jgi:hypothetical protein
VSVRSDISQLQTAVNAFKTKYEVDYLPSRIILCNNLNNQLYSNSQLGIDSKAFLLRMWPRLGNYGPGNPNNGLIYIGAGSGWMPDDTGASANSAYLLEGDQCLVFFLGGIQMKDPVTGLPACRGFGTNKANPTIVVNSPTDPVLFEFLGSRLGQILPRPQSQNVGYSFFDVYGTPPTPGAQWDPTQGEPYAYFSSYSNGYNPYFTLFQTSDCALISANTAAAPQGLWPYFQTTTNPRQYLNNNGFQIICAGRDKMFGPGNFWDPRAGFGPWAQFQNAGQPGNPGGDDISSFSQRLLSEPQQ